MIENLRSHLRSKYFHISDRAAGQLSVCLIAAASDLCPLSGHLLSSTKAWASLSELRKPVCVFDCFKCSQWSLSRSQTKGLPRCFWVVGRQWQCLGRKSPCFERMMEVRPECWCVARGAGAEGALRLGRPWQALSLSPCRREETWTIETASWGMQVGYGLCQRFSF